MMCGILSSSSLERDDTTLANILGGAAGLMTVFHPAWARSVALSPALGVATICLLVGANQAVRLIARNQSPSVASWFAILISAGICPTLLPMALLITALYAMRWWRREISIAHWKASLLVWVAGISSLHVLASMNPWHASKSFAHGPLTTISENWQSLTIANRFGATGRALLESVGPLMASLMAIGLWSLCAGSKKLRLFAAGAAAALLVPCFIHSPQGQIVPLVLISAILTAVGIERLGSSVTIATGRWIMGTTFAAIAVAGLLAAW
jgi:hypothetical protein